jgi:hypothetical protein
MAVKPALDEFWRAVGRRSDPFINEAGDFNFLLGR